MSTLVTKTKIGHPELYNGDRMSREEFHALYEQTPEDFRAELIGGVVYVSSPMKRAHGSHHLVLGMVFGIYEGETPGVECGDNTTLLLGEESEPQPDLYLRILPEYGGQSKTTADDYVAGPPEFIAEIAHSSRAIDLHAKYEDYKRYGVQEYLVVSLRENELDWFDLRADEKREPDSDGILRMRTFPGLWIDRKALLTRNHRRLTDVLQHGLATSEHGQFVQQLESRQDR